MKTIVILLISSIFITSGCGIISTKESSEANSKVENIELNSIYFSNIYKSRISIPDYISWCIIPESADELYNDDPNKYSQQFFGMRNVIVISDEKYDKLLKEIKSTEFSFINSLCENQMDIFWYDKGERTNLQSFDLKKDKNKLLGIMNKYLQESDMKTINKCLNMVNL